MYLMENSPRKFTTIKIAIWINFVHFSGFNIKNQNYTYICIYILACIYSKLNSWTLHETSNMLIFQLYTELYIDQEYIVWVPDEIEHCIRIMLHLYLPRSILGIFNYIINRVNNITAQMMIKKFIYFVPKFRCGSIYRIVRIVYVTYLLVHWHSIYTHFTMLLYNSTTFGYSGGNNITMCT